jgi:hypothetical protein
MHRTEGAYNESNLFVDGPPGTTIEAAWLNAVQEEIANVIEAVGTPLLLESTDTRTQLRDAINSLVVAAGISDIAYDATTWNGVTSIGPSKNAVRDEMETRAKKRGPDVATKTDNYNVTTDDFGKSLRMNSVADKAFTLCSVGANEDGVRITFVKQGTGKVTINAADVDYIHDSSATGTIYSTSDYATITLEYVHGMIRWVIISAVGAWTTT